MSGPAHHVTVHALEAGWFTMPERFFVTPLENQEAKKAVPSLSFLIQHVDPASTTTTRIVFDLGLRRDVGQYSEQILNHVATRQPLSTVPDVVDSLARGGLTPDDIDFVVLSHLHWDHIGTPRDFKTSKFIIGSGGLSLLKGDQGAGSHNKFEPDLLPLERTIELHNPQDNTDLETRANGHGQHLQPFNLPWQSKGPFPHALDIFRDGSVFIVWAPGHLVGHVNLLCRKKGGDYIYLGGDAAHDIRLISGEKDIATWEDTTGQICCIHQDREAARETMARIRSVKNGETSLGAVEVILAHDSEWAHQAKAKGQLFPAEI